jgi:hypothetical protein
LIADTFQAPLRGLFEPAVTGYSSGQVSPS